MPAGRDLSTGAEAGVRKSPRKEPAGARRAISRLWRFDGSAAPTREALGWVRPTRHHSRSARGLALADRFRTDVRSPSAGTAWAPLLGASEGIRGLRRRRKSEYRVERVAEGHRRGRGHARPKTGYLAASANNPSRLSCRFIFIFKGLIGGCSRTRTYDPLIKSWRRSRSW
jgi:hypothetical protein